LVMANASYYPQYYVQLAVPLSVLCGALLKRQVGASIQSPLARERGSRLPVGMLLGVGVLLLGLLSGAGWRQVTEIRDLLAYSNPTYYNVADYLRRSSAPEAKILAFEPNYAFLASRPLAGAQPDRFLVDSYGEMLYVNLGIEQRSMWSLVPGIIGGKKGALQTTFWGEAAQAQALAAFEQADYVVMDGRARYQLEPRTLAAMQTRSIEVIEVGVATLRRRQ
jgi:hypothetical protein